MGKQIKDISITLSGGLKVCDHYKIKYFLESQEDPRMGAQVIRESCEDEEIEKYSQALWERCCALIQKYES